MVAKPTFVHFLAFLRHLGLPASTCRLPVSTLGSSVALWATKKELSWRCIAQRRVKNNSRTLPKITPEPKYQNTSWAACELKSICYYRTQLHAYTDKTIMRVARFRYKKNTRFANTVLDCKNATSGWGSSRHRCDVKACLFNQKISSLSARQYLRTPPLRGTTGHRPLAIMRVRSTKTANPDLQKSNLQILDLQNATWEWGSSRHRWEVNARSLQSEISMLSAITWHNRTRNGASHVGRYEVQQASTPRKTKQNAVKTKQGKSIEKYCGP